MNNRSRMAWAAFGVASFFYAYQYILRVLPNIAMPDIMSRFQMDEAMFGQFSGVYYIGYAAAHIPIGILLDRFGPKKMIPLFILLTALGMLPLLATDYWVYPVVGRVLIGIGSSSAILGVFKILRSSFPENRFTHLLSVAVIIGLLGAIYGGLPVNTMRQTLGFEKLLTVLILGAVALSAIAYILTPKMENVRPSVSVFEEVRLVMSNTKVLLICLIAGLMVGPLEGFADVWGKSFLQNVYNLDDATASSLPSMVFFGMCFGGPILSMISEYTKRHVLVVLSCAIIMAASFAWILIGIKSTIALSIVFFVVGILCAYQIIAIYLASTYVPMELAGLTSAVANMFIMTFGYVFHTVIGKVIASSISSGETVSDAFQMGVSVVPAALALSVIILVVSLRHLRRA